MRFRFSPFVYGLLGGFFAFMLLSGGAALAAKPKEHPLIRPYPGSVLAKNMSKYYRYKDHDFYCINPKTKKRMKRKIKGEYYYLLYEVRKPSGKRVKDISTLEFFENYKNAAAEKGGKTVYEGGGQLVFTLPKPNGGTTWCRVTTNAGLGQQYLLIVDEKGLKTRLTFGPKEMKAALDKDGKILLYGIYFDVDKAFLKPKSVKQLQHIVTLLKLYPGLKLEVQGHTDNQGSDKHNLDLSKRRARTVCTYLNLFGIASERLLPVGYGETRPVAANSSKEGRAKNRRVELVKMLSAKAAQKKTAPPAAKADFLVGVWNMTPNQRVKQGTITFRKNGTYLMKERLNDGAGVSQKGEYRIYGNKSPKRIDICLNRCGQPGSQYTTAFAIFRVLPDKRLEICSSRDGKYPARFNGSPDDDYTMILTRAR